MARRAQDRLNLQAECASWCTIDKIPKPPRDVHEAAGDGPLRPAFIRPLGILGLVLAAPFAPLLMILSLLSTVEQAVERLLDSKSERARAKVRTQEAKQQKAAITAQGLDQVFDGDWTGAAGQFLLRWYSHSSHPKRFLVLASDRIVLAAPPKRVSIRQEEQTRVVAEIPAAEAVVEDPLLGMHPNGRLRIRFTGGSWLTVTTEEPRSEIHMYLMRQPRLGSRHHTAE